MSIGTVIKNIALILLTILLVGLVAAVGFCIGYAVSEKKHDSWINLDKIERDIKNLFKE